jgi:hypothetical protein
MEKIDADSDIDCTDKSLMKILESTKERGTSVTAEFVKAKVLATVTFAVSEKDLWESWRKLVTIILCTGI